MQKLFIVPLILVTIACTNSSQNQEEKTEKQTDSKTETIQPKYVTDPIGGDSDDPAIWINHANPSESLIIGTDKGEEEDGISGGLYVFNLQGKEDSTKSVTNLQRPNNVDIAYGFVLGKDTIDIAVCTERYTNSIRVFKLPEMEAIDNGGIPVFEGDSMRSPMGISLYTRPSDQQIFAIVGRKEGPTDGSYLWQYALEIKDGVAVGNLVRKFGVWSGEKEIEAIAVDNEAGYVYFSDERHSIKKYYADPAKGNEEILQFGKENFLEDREGISIYKTGENTGYVLVSNQSNNSFQVFDRSKNNKFIAELPFSTNNSDGSDAVNYNFGEEFPEGIFVAMSDNKTFQIYDWRDIQSAIEKAKNQE